MVMVTISPKGDNLKYNLSMPVLTGKTGSELMNDEIMIIEKMNIQQYPQATGY